jgi:8-oxo-dGTP diphosphatase
MARTLVQAAGGIVLRQAKLPLIAVVRLRKRNEWVLPKGKLDDGETARDAAEREVNEETGHDVIVHEFLGTLVYESGGRSKVVHYWRMQADGDQVYELMTDIREVDWLPLDTAVERLSRSYERAFLENVGPMAVSAALADIAKGKARAAPLKKRRARPAAPVSAPVAAPVPAQVAEPMPAPVEVPPAASRETVVVAGDKADEAAVLETPEPLLPVDQPELMPSDDPEQPVAVPEAADALVCEPAPATAEADPPFVETAEPINTPAADAAGARRKTLAELLRGWLGGAA